MLAAKRGADLRKGLILASLFLVSAAACAREPGATAVPTNSAPAPVSAATPVPCAACPVQTQAATAVPANPPPAWATPSGDIDVLPAPLYFVSERDRENDLACPAPHVVRLARDGHTRNPIGSCYMHSLHGFDVSPRDGSLVLAAEDALWLLDARGQNARRLAWGLPDPEYAYGDFWKLQDPAWSPDGSRITFADGGIYILEVATGARTDVIENRCFLPDELWGTASCFYGDWFMEPRWSPDGQAILFREQTSDYPAQQVFEIGPGNAPQPVPGTLGVVGSNIAWSPEGKSLIFDYWWPANVGPITSTEPALVRLALKDFSVQVLWPHGDRADPVYSSAGNNPYQVLHPVELEDGRIRFFRAEPCSTGSCYRYSLVEGRLAGETFETRVLVRDALSAGIRDVWWHPGGDFAALLASTGDTWFLGVLQVSTGQTWLLAEEPGWQGAVVWGGR